MKIYVKIYNKEIYAIEECQIDSTYVEYDVVNIDNFYSKIQGFKLDSDLEEKLINLFDNSKEEISKLSQYDIKHWVSNRSFGELIDMYDNGEIVKPDMQRRFVWDSLKCSRLIESIIMGLPIPPLFLLEVGKNKYEIIDGFQRLNTLYNYINGKPWNYDQNQKRKVTSRLSSKVSEEIKGKTFNELEPEYQRVLKRSTIPLIEFKQLTPETLTSKYLIFERINTGSEKLSPMQIRKSLSYGEFIKDLYEYSEKNELFLKLFSKTNINKDSHVEVLLRIFVMDSIYNNSFTIKKEGIKNILDEFCETNKNEHISEEKFKKFSEALAKSSEIFKNNRNMFKKVENIEGEYYFLGNLNIAIMETFIALLMNMEVTIGNDQILENYKKIFSTLILESIEEKRVNPFSTSTGTISSINSRFEICKKILEV